MWPDDHMVGRGRNKLQKIPRSLGEGQKRREVDRAGFYISLNPKKGAAGEIMEDQGSRAGGSCRVEYKKVVKKSRDDPPPMTMLLSLLTNRSLRGRQRGGLKVKFEGREAQFFQ